MSEDNPAKKALSADLFGVAEKPQEKPAEIGKPVQFSAYVPEKILSDFLKKSNISRDTTYRALGLVPGEDGREYMLIEPIPVSLPLGSALSTFGPQQMREYLQNPDSFPQYRQIPPEYLQLGRLN